MIDLIEAHNAGSDDESLNKLLDKNYKEMSEFRSPSEGRWSEYERFYDGKQWPSGEKKPVDNVIFQTIEGIVPALTDSMPGTDVLARNENAEEAVRQLQSHLNYTYEYNNLHLKLVSAVRKSLISTSPYFYTYYDPDADNGQGMAINKLLGWRMVYLDPMAYDLDSCSKAMIKVPLRVAEIEKMYPAHKGKIKAQTIQMDTAGNVVNPASESKHSYSIENNSADRFKVEDAAFLEEHWFKDYTMEPIPDEETAAEIADEEVKLVSGEMPELSKWENHELHRAQHTFDLYKMVGQILGVDQSQVTDEMIEMAKQDPEAGPIIALWIDHIELHETYIGENYKPERPKYKNFWRKVVRVGKIILDKDDEPFMPAGKIPLTPIYAYKDEDSIYSEGDVKNIIEHQKVINEMDYALICNVRLLGNPQFVNSANSGVDSNEITNAPGKIYSPKEGSEFRVITPPTIGNDFRLIREERKESVKRISGMTDAAQGVSPGAGASGKMVRLLQEQALSRIRLKSRLLESYTMTRLGIINAAFIVKFAVARKIRSVDNDGNYIYIDYNPGEVQDLVYDIVTAPGTTAGPDRETNSLELKEAMAGGLIDFPTYLKAVNPPYKRAILSALQNSDQKEATLRQLQEENLKMRAKFMPDTLTKEEMQIIQEMQLQQAREVNV